MSGLYEKLIINKNIITYCKQICPKDCIFTELKIINLNVDQYSIIEGYELYC